MIGDLDYDRVDLEHVIKLFGWFVHSVSLHSLPHLDPEDSWGARVFVGWRCPVMVYDDDGEICLCERIECENMRTFCEDAGSEAYEMEYCVCGVPDCEKTGVRHGKHGPRQTAFLLGPEGTCDEVPHYALRRFPDGYAPPQLDEHTGDGWLYAVATQPDLSLHRVKLGFTTNLGERMRSYVTLCPRAMLLKAWPADAHDEMWLFSVADGFRFYKSEEFDLPRPFEAFEKITLALKKRHDEEGRVPRLILPPSTPSRESDYDDYNTDR